MVRRYCNAPISLDYACAVVCLRQGFGLVINLAWRRTVSPLRANAAFLPRGSC